MSYVTTLMEVAKELKSGGRWLSRAREWMQSNVRNGDTLVWSSNEPVSIPFASLEDFALTVATAAVAEERTMRTGPGSPHARFLHLMDELEARFPHPNPFDSTKTPEAYVLEAIDRMIRMSAGGVPTGWVPWEGDGQLPDPGSYVAYKLLNGDLEMNPRQAGTLCWSRGKGEEWEIIAYKVLVP